VSDQAKAKEAVHDAIQNTASAAGLLDGGVLVRWYVIGEFALPGSDHALVKMSGTPDGHDLRSWEAEGLLFRALFGPLLRGG
jgi:hypothetical protein